MEEEGSSRSSTGISERTALNGRNQNDCADDIVVLERSTLLGRTLVTDNMRHFLALHQRFLAEQRTHAGLVLASSRSYPRSKRTIGLWINGLESAIEKHGSAPTSNLCEWLR